MLYFTVFFVEIHNYLNRIDHFSSSGSHQTASSGRHAGRQAGEIPEPTQQYILQHFRRETGEISYLEQLCICENTRCSPTPVYRNTLQSVTIETHHFQSPKWFQNWVKGTAWHFHSVSVSVLCNNNRLSDIWLWNILIATSEDNEITDTIAGDTPKQTNRYKR